nr:U1 small nuclear ribonucleoprotein C isoform X2 [Phascolarctos cinereus]
MEEQAQSLIDKTTTTLVHTLTKFITLHEIVALVFQLISLHEVSTHSRSSPTQLLSCCISARKNSSQSILCSSTRRGYDPTSSYSPGTSSTWYDASTPYGRAPYDANDGPSSSWNDACGACSWDEAAHGRPHAYDAWTPNDETSCASHDGAHSARNDPPRQIRIKGNLFVSLFYSLFYSTQTPWCCTFWGVFQQHGKEDLLPLLSKKKPFRREQWDRNAAYIYIVMCKNKSIDCFSYRRIFFTGFCCCKMKNSKCDSPALMLSSHSLISLYPPCPDLQGQYTWGVEEDPG